MFSIRVAMAVMVGLGLAGCAAVPTHEQEPAIREQVLPATAGKEAERLARLAEGHVESYNQSRDVRHLDQAIDALRALDRLQPGDPGVNLMLYRVLAQKALTQRDEGLLEELKDRYDAAYRMAPTLTRELAPPAFVAAELYWAISSRKGLSAEREKAYEDKAIEALRDVIRDRPEFAPAHVKLGWVYYFRDLNELALFEAREAVRLAPESADAQLLLGRIYRSSIHEGPDCWDEHAIEEGIKAYKRAVALAPEEAAGHIGLSFLYLHREAYELSVFEAREAVRLHRSPYTLMRVGVSLIFLGDYDEAIGALQQALETDPQYASALEWMGFAHFVRRDLEKAVQYYRRAAQAQKKPQLYPSLNLALALQSLGRDEEAAAALDKLGESFQGDDWERWLLRFSRGEIDESKLLAAADNRCKRTEALFFSGYRQVIVGEPERARAQFRQAMALQAYCNSEFVSARAELRHLEGE